MRPKPNIALALTLGAVLGAAVAHAPDHVRKAHAEHDEPENGDVLEELTAGNVRFLEGQARHPHSDSRFMEELETQHPRAIVITCSDSRVVPEILFDQGLGDTFTIRVAGNVLEPAIVGSVEYAVEHLGTSFVLVLGHSRCGGVAAALAAHGHPADFVALGPNLERLVEHIEPAIGALPLDLAPAARLDAAVEANVRLVTDELSHESEVIRHGVESKKLRVVAGLCDLTHGKVTILRDARAR